MKFAQADYFRVPLLDGRFAVGQVLEVDKLPAGTVFCALASRITDAVATISPLRNSDITAFVLTRSKFLTDGTWALAGFDQIPDYSALFDFEQQRQLDFPSTPIHDPAVIEAYLNAWHGLYKWDGFGDLFERIKHPDVAPPPDKVLS